MDPRFAVKRMKQYVFVLFLLTFFFHVSAESQLSLNAGGVERVELAGLLVNIMDSRDQPNYIDMVLNEYTTDKKTQQSVLVGQNICRYTTPLPRQRAPENSKICERLNPTFDGIFTTLEDFDTLKNKLNRIHRSFSPQNTFRLRMSNNKSSLYFNVRFQRYELEVRKLWTRATEIRWHDFKCWPNRDGVKCVWTPENHDIRVLRMSSFPVKRQMSR